MAQQKKFVKTSQVGTVQTWTNPSDFSHVLKNGLTVAQKMPHSVQNGVKLHNAKWFLRENAEIAALRAVAGSNPVTEGTEKISFFFETSGSVENQAALLLRLDEFLKNVRLAMTDNLKGVPFLGDFNVTSA